MAVVSFRRGVWVFDRIGNDGKRKVTKCKDETEARGRLDRYLKRKELGLPPDEETSSRKRKEVKLVPENADSTLISDAIKKFEKVVLSGSRKPKILKIERGFMKTLYNSFYDQEVFYVGQITTEHVDTLFAQLRTEYAPGSVNRIFNVHKQFFKTMVRWGLLAKDPSEAIGQLAVKAKPKQVWSDEIFEAALAKFPDWSRPVFRFIRVTGCRPSQATMLTWSEVNLATKTWHTFSEKGKQRKELYFPIPPGIDEMLTQLRQVNRRRFRAKPEDPVFLNADGTGPIRTDYLYTIIRRAGRTREGRKTELAGFCTYGLRTTFGTRLTAEGMPLKFVAELMGHSDTRTTERWYVKDVSVEARRAFEKRFEETK